MPSTVAESPLRTQVVPILIPRTSEYGRFPGAGEINCTDGIQVANLTLQKKVILDYTGGPK